MIRNDSTMIFTEHRKTNNKTYAMYLNTFQRTKQKREQNHGTIIL